MQFARVCGSGNFMELGAKIATFVEWAAEWPHTRKCLILVTAMSGLAGVYLLPGRPPANELVPIDVAISGTAPALVVRGQPSNSIAPVPSEVAIPPLVDEARKAAAQTVAVPEGLPPPAPAIAVWAGLLASRTTRADVRRPALASAGSAGVAVDTKTVAPVVLRGEVQPPVRARRRVRAVQYVYVHPRRTTYRKRARTTTLGSISRSVTRNLNTVSRVLSSIAN